MRQGRTCTASGLWQLVEISYELRDVKKVVSFVLNHTILDGKIRK